jgi:hypothetical protein
MYKKIALIAVIACANIAFATDSDKNAVVTAKDNAVMIATAKDSWSMVAMNNNNGMTKIREFHEMGDSGVQQIDYVVNCSNQTLALSGFAVMTSKGRLTSNAPPTTSSTLSFYKPVIEHDQRISSNVCKNLVTMNTAVSQ